MQSWFTAGHPRKRRATPVLAGALASALVLAGCTGAQNIQDQSATSGTATEVVALPSLSTAQVLREEVASAEAAIVARTGELAQLATECESCADSLSATESEAATRLTLLGGTWDAWGTTGQAATAANSLELQPEVADAPYQVGPLTAYMWTTARLQLSAASTESSLDAQQREAFGSILFGRAVSARLLAADFSVDLADQVAKLSSEASASLTSSYNAVESSASGQESHSGDADSLAQASAALVAYDCARSTLMTTPDSLLPGVGAASLGEILNERAKELVRLGVPDTRSTRCLNADQDVSESLSQIVLADLQLLAAEDVALRELAVDYLMVDARVWAVVSPSTAPTTSLVQIEGMDSGPQS